MSDEFDTKSFRAGQSIELTVSAEVICTYPDSRIKVKWNKGEEIMLPSDMRLENE